MIHSHRPSTTPLSPAARVILAAVVAVLSALPTAAHAADRQAPVGPRFDTIVGTPLPGPVAGLFRDVLSPYCPGLTLESCPSPQADSLRKALRARYEDGEAIDVITASLRDHYGPDVIGSPPVSGLGAAAWLGPILLLVVGAFAIQRWLRRNQRGPRSAAGNTPAPRPPTVEA